MELIDVIGILGFAILNTGLIYFFNQLGDFQMRRNYLKALRNKMKNILNG